MSSPPTSLTELLADRYRIEREIWRGSTATVHLAEDLRHHRRVAVKVLGRGLAESVDAERFMREIAIAAQLTHPHIVPLFDSGSADGQLYYVMPYFEGETLRTRLAREGRLGIDVAIGIASDVAAALEHAHQRAVVHRDIKPENILLHAGGALVTDFGIAKAIGPAQGAGLTAAGMTLGTPAYMSPEQVAADAQLDARSDVYSLGIVLFEMLTGAPPFTGRTPQAALAQRMSIPAPLVTTRRAEVPAHVSKALARALERDPAERFASAGAFAATLQTPPASAGTTTIFMAAVPRAVVVPPTAPPGTDEYPTLVERDAVPPRWSARRIAGLAALAAVVLVAAVLAIRALAR